MISNGKNKDPCFSIILQKCLFFPCVPPSFQDREWYVYRAEMDDQCRFWARKENFIIQLYWIIKHSPLPMHYFVYF